MAALLLLYTLNNSNDGYKPPRREAAFISQSILLVGNFVSRIAVNHTGGNSRRGAGRVADVVSEARAILNGRGITGRFRLGAVARDDFVGQRGGVVGGENQLDILRAGGFGVSGGPAV